MNKILILNNKKCQIFLDEPNTLAALRNRLSFKMAGVEFTPAYQDGWSGITYLLTDTTNKFNIGLLSNVKDFLAERGIDYSIEDLRQSKTNNAEIDISEKLNKLELVPRDYQIRALNAAIDNERGIIRAATGSGKTLIIAMIVAKINKPTIIYVIGLDLLDQFHKLFSSIFDEKIGYIGNGICDIQRITIASIWTIGKALNVKDIVMDEEEVKEKTNSDNYERIRSLLKSTRVHILDECHIVTCTTISEIYKKINPEHIYGLSGTPYRDDNTDLLVTSILGDKIIDISASELIEKRVLSQPIIKFFPVPKRKDLGTQYLSIYRNYIVENEVRNKLIVEKTIDLLNKNYVPLVLFKQIRHGYILQEMFEEAGVKSSMLYGNDSLEKRNEVKDMLFNGEIQVILASSVFDIGLDLKILSGLVLAGGGKSSVRALQRIGRVIRMYKNRRYSAVVDFYDQAKFLKKHSLIRYNIYSSEPGFRIIKCKGL